MGRTILCTHCSSTFNEDFLKLKDDENICPVCGSSLGDDVPVEDRPTDEELAHPDLYFYVIDSENKHKDKRLRKVWCQCISCRTSKRIPYDSFDYISRDYLRLKEGLDLTCEACGRQITKRIVPQRPESWTVHEYIPKCPTCGSGNIKKISASSKAASVAMWGLLSRKVHKQWHCRHCGSEW
ncbi:MAG: hypothetical protein HFH36_11955 [Lachnospiraceae bacterium]|nr:hypothetical protein [Lachnospiraceae bacterium]